jgi:hypothetical protein
MSRKRVLEGVVIGVLSLLAIGFLRRVFPALRNFQ